MKIIIASNNPIKIESTKEGFKQMFDSKAMELVGDSIPSGVSDQPMTEKETLEGALNRAENAAQKYPRADFWVGIEGGIENTAHGMIAFAWVVIKSIDKIGRARSASFFLPPQIQKLVNEGMELGHADDQVFGVSNSKHHSGAIGLLTDDLIDRKGLYLPAVIMALIPFKKSALY